MGAAMSNEPGVTAQARLILESILTNQRLDGAAYALSDARAGVEPLALRPRIPPILEQAALQYPSDAEAARTASSLTLTDLEELSLVARLRLTQHLPPGVDELWRERATAMPTVKAEDLLAAIHAAAAQFDGSAPDFHGRQTDDQDAQSRFFDAGAQRHSARRGLQITGCHIEGGLELVNAQLPFSVRLLGCAIDGAIMADHCRITTLDLSCSAVHGVYATFLRAAGSVRMRRTFSTGPVDFGGARISAVFDASDSVTLPASDPPATEAYVGDRGVFNLSLATVENEVRLRRARIYGGLTLKGATIQRSLFLEDAILRGPLAVLELIAFNKASAPKAFAPAAHAHAGADRVLAEALHSVPGVTPSAFSAAFKAQADRISLEVLEGSVLSALGKAAPSPHADIAPRLLMKLLGESMRGRTSSLRGDGLKVDGSVFARGLRSGGRLRLKYVEVGGGLHLNGARLRASLYVARALHAAAQQDSTLSRISELMDETYRQAKLREPERDDDYALDVRESTIGGALSVGGTRDSTTLSMAAQRLNADLDAAIRARLAGDRPVWGDDGEGLAVPPSSERTLIVGAIALTGIRIVGDLDLSGVIANVFDWVDETGAPATPARMPGAQTRHFLRAMRAEIGGGMDFRDAIGIDGVDAARAVINGTVLFAEEPRFNGLQWENVQRCARLLSGDIVFAGAHIGGNAVFIFERDAQSSLFLGLAEFKARLSIIPWCRAFEMDRADYEAFVADPRIPNGFEIPARVPLVDLRNARAVVFGHPPSAWPYEDGLVIEGFHFERSRTYGPLPARRRSLPTALEDHNRYWRYFAPFYLLFRLRSPRALLADMKNPATVSSGKPDRLSQLVVGTGLFALAGVIAWLVLSAFWGAYIAGFARGATASFGAVNLSLLALLFLYVAIKPLLKNRTWPKEADARPLAVDWLRLQRAQLNVYRVLQRVWPLEPYGQAARLLRAAGRVQSADWVERERMVLRRRTMSWRHHFPARAFLFMADALTKYGFGIARAVAISLFLIGISACLFHQADTCGMILPKADNVISSAYIISPPSAAGVGSGAPQSSQPDAAIPEPPSGVVLPAAEAPPPYPPFVSLIYAIDVAVPILSLDQEEYWRPGARATQTWAASQACLLDPAPRTAQALELLRVLLAGLGWLLASAVALALLTRAETIMSRSEQ